MKGRSLPAAALLAVLGGCTGEATTPTAAFEEVFFAVDSLVLEEPPGYPIEDAHKLTVAHDGRIVVADTRSHTVRIHHEDGSLAAMVGGFGEGPGELRLPVAGVITADGHLFVIASRRVHRFTPDLQFDTIFDLAGERGANRMTALGDDLLLRTVGWYEPGFDVFRRYSRDGQLIRTFHEEHPTYITAAYWREQPESFAIGEKEIFIANDKIPKIYRYTLDGEPIDTFGTPAASWRQASEPRPGEFRPPYDRGRFEAWRRSFTFISDMALYRDSLLVVSIARYDPDNLAYRDPSYRADIYDVRTTEKLYEDISLPGDLAGGGEHVRILTMDPARGWVLTDYALSDR
jgi:hypothetical protein